MTNSKGRKPFWGSWWETGEQQELENLFGSSSHTQKAMRLTLVTPSLSCGGAERAAILIAEELLKKGHHVYFVTIAETEIDSYKVQDGVHRLALNIAGNSP